MSEQAWTKEPWVGYRLTNEGQPFRADSLAEYVANTSRLGDPNEFMAVVVDREDGDCADVAHFGNGPTSVANMARSIACVNALAGMNPEHLGELLEAVEWMVRKELATADVVTALARVRGEEGS